MRASRLPEHDLEGDLADLAEILFGDLDDEDAEMPEPGVDLDEAWHGVDCLLTGTAWDLGDGPAGEAILGGEEIGRGPGIQLRQPVRPEKSPRARRVERRDFNEYPAGCFTELRDSYVE